MRLELTPRLVGLSNQVDEEIWQGLGSLSQGADRSLIRKPTAEWRFDGFAMAVNLQKPGVESTRTVPGLSLGTAMAGIRKANRRDLTVVTLEPGASVAGVFTANR